MVKDFLFTPLFRHLKKTNIDNINFTHDGESNVIFYNNLLFIQNTDGIFELFDDIDVCYQEKKRIRKILCFHEVSFSKRK